MNNELDDWLEWTDARGASLEDLGFREWLSELIRKEREEAWDEAYREVRGIPHWWNTEDQYGEFDLQPLGPDQTSERGAFMEVRKVLAVNPYRKEQP